MGINVNQIFWGEGVAFIGGYEAFEVQELAVNIGKEILEAPKGDGGGNISIPSRQPITGRLGFLGVNATLLSVLTGGTVTSSANVKRIREETLAKSGDALTPSESTFITNTIRVVPSGAGKQPLIRSSSSPSVGEYQVSGSTLALNASQTETNFIVSYFYTDTEGETLTIAPSDLPSTFELYGSIRTREQFDAGKGDIIVYGAKCDIVSEFGLQSSVANINTLGFDFNMNNESSGDIVLYFPAA